MMYHQKKEKNKALIIGLIGAFFLLAFATAFVCVWFQDLNILKINPFENKGNWLIAGVYLVELALLMKVYGGLKIGHLARWNVILSQILALAMCNAIMAVQIILIVGDMHRILEIVTAIVWLMIIDIVYRIVA